MSSSPLRRALLAVPALALLALAPAAQAGDHGAERLVVRGDSTIVDGTVRPGRLPAADERRRVPRHARHRRLRRRPDARRRRRRSRTARAASARRSAAASRSAPAADRLILAVDGDSCQDGAGPVTAASFTGVATFKVTHGTGRYAKAHGRGLATFSEDAADHDRMTLVGRIAR